MTLPSTVIYPEAFRDVFDWEFLLPIFAGTKVTPMDIDFIVEKAGRFLVIENKRPGKDMPRGQSITYNALVDTGFFTVFSIQGGKQPSEICHLEIRFFLHNWHSATHLYKAHEANKDTVYREAEAWWNNPHHYTPRRHA